MDNIDELPNHAVDRYERQPDVGGNRHYDYLTLEEYQAAEASLDTKKKWSELTSNEIVVLRDRARKCGLISDIVDHSDRLLLLRCLFSHCENRDEWMEKCIELRREKTFL